MKIPVDRLTATPTSFHYDAGSPWWSTRMQSERGLPGELSEPFRVEVSAHVMGESVGLEGTLEGALELECSRCVARYRHALRESFRLVLEPAGTRSPADPQASQTLAHDGMCLGDELETGWYRGSEVELDGFVLEVISLALPVKPLCRDDCAGLCARCGADRNELACGCEETHSQSPFAVLASLRGGESGGVT
jgi:uncharacterized protein